MHNDQLNQAITLLESRYSDEVICHETGLSSDEIQNIRTISGIRKIAEGELCDSLSRQLEWSLPRLYETACKELERIMVSPRTPEVRKLEAIRLSLEFTKEVILRQVI